MKTLFQTLVLTFVLLALGCSDTNFDYKTPIVSGMKIRVQGDTKKRFKFSIREHRFSDSGSESSSSYGHNQVSTSTGDRFEFKIDAATDGVTAGFLVPFDDKVTVELVSGGKVIDSKVSTKAGTVLILELGKLRKDREPPLADYQLDAEVELFRKSLFKTLQSDAVEQIEGFTFSETDTGKQFAAFIKQLIERCGPAEATAAEYWIAAPVERSDMIQGVLRFGERNIPVIFGTGDADDGKLIGFVVCEYEPAGSWTPVEHWRDQMKWTDSEETAE